MTNLKIDSTDLRILAAIQNHGLVSKYKLAELVNLSPTPCFARVSRLKTAGLIGGTHGYINLAKIGEYFHVIVTVSLTHHRKTDFERFESYIHQIDEIIQCISTGGGMDYVLEIVTPSLQSFQELIAQMLEAELEIDRYITYIVTKRVKQTPPNLYKLFNK